MIFFKVNEDGSFTPIEEEPLNMYDIGREQGRKLEAKKWQSKIGLIISAIPNMAHWKSADGQDLVMAYDAIRLIKETIDGEC